MTDFPKLLTLFFFLSAVQLSLPVPLRGDGGEIATHWSRLTEEQRVVYTKYVFPFRGQGFDEPEEDYNVHAYLSTRDDLGVYTPEQEALVAAAVEKMILVQLYRAALIESFGEPSEEEINSLIEAHNARLVEAEANAGFPLYSILVRVFDEESEDEARALINAAHAELQAGTSFSDVAAKYSDARSRRSGGYAGAIRPGILPPDTEQVAMNLEEGVVSEPVRLRSGYYIFRRDPKSAKRPQLSRGEAIEQWQGGKIYQQVTEETKRYFAQDGVVLHNPEIDRPGSLNDPWIIVDGKVYATIGEVLAAYSFRDLDIEFKNEEVPLAIEEEPFYRLAFQMAALGAEMRLHESDTFHSAKALADVVYTGELRLRNWYQQIEATDDELEALLNENRERYFPDKVLYSGYYFRTAPFYKVADGVTQPSLAGEALQKALATIHGHMRGSDEPEPKVRLEALTSIFPDSRLITFSAADSIGPFVDLHLKRTEVGRFSRPFDSGDTAAVLYVTDKQVVPCQLEDIRESVALLFRRQALQKMVGSVKDELKVVPVQ